MKGHWPRGKSRNGISPEKDALIRELRAFFKREDNRSSQDRISRRSAAELIGVSDRTLRRWLAGVDVPPDDAVPAIKSLMRSW